MATIEKTTGEASATPVSHPLVLEPILVERIWGTDDLSPWHSNPASGKAVGEIWLTAEECKTEGGQTLAELTKAAPEHMGDSRGEGFPLLIKLLFPREKLSVQVHPNDAEAQALGMPRGKTECWYVLSAEPGAQVALGFTEPLDKDQVKAAIQDGSLESKLRMVPVKAGDLVFVDAGTIHAIGPGMVVLETQQYSDTTYRLWDYGRPRELHVDAGTAVTRSETRAGLVQSEQMEGFVRLVSGEYFAVDRYELGAGATELSFPDHLQILIALGEGCTVADISGTSIPVPKGKAVILPAGEKTYRIQGSAGTEVVRVLQP